MYICRAVLRGGQECVGIDEAALTVGLREGDELGQVSSIHIQYIVWRLFYHFGILFLLLHTVAAAVVRREEDEARAVC